MDVFSIPCIFRLSLTRLPLRYLSNTYEYVAAFLISSKVLRYWRRGEWEDLHYVLLRRTELPDGRPSGTNGWQGESARQMESLQRIARFPAKWLVVYSPVNHCRSALNFLGRVQQGFQVRDEQ